MADSAGTIALIISGVLNVALIFLHYRRGADALQDQRQDEHRIEQALTNGYRLGREATILVLREVITELRGKDR